ncbi:MAG: hypothetical protein HQ583_03225 [Candidatus Abyssubacteria bacterium]|nr:hypothetical protein [Candidatus Abyssubacteria bacterium]
MQLKDSPRVFIIGMGGGIDVWAAKIWNARFVKAIELNKAILDIHRDVLPNYSRVLLDDPNIQMVVAEGRGALMRETDEYDIIQMSGIDTWTALTSGSYVLAEDYLYTRDAVMSMYAHLAPEGILQITRFAGVAESLRVLSNIYSAFEAEGILDFDKSVICISDRLFMTFLVKKGTFTAEEMGKIARFSDELQLEKVYIPDRNSGALAEIFIRTDDKEAFIRKCSRNISPTTDDRPYFFFFSRWLSPFKKDAYYSWKPSTAFEVKPFFIVFQLILSTVLSLVLIVLPLVIFARKGIDYAWFKRFFVYFAGLGLGFIGIEIALMQKLTLFLGHPLYSITVTLFSILVFAGLGSLLSASWFRLPDRRVWLVPLGLAVLLGMFIVLSPGLTAYCIRLPLPARIAIAIGCLAPISLLLGVPFAYGIRLLNKLNPSIVPWAWAVNGCCTVIGSILAMVLSMNLGFNAVLIIAVLTYIVAFGALGESR